MYDKYRHDKYIDLHNGLNLQLALENADNSKGRADFCSKCVLSYCDLRIR